jgi:hypothetical protein
MRRVIYIPLIHSSADLGSLSKSVQAHYQKICGKISWNQREDILQALWTDIEASLIALRLDARKVRIYQDGLPVCGFEEKIVHELAKAGSGNHQLILRLLAQGSTLMGTEDAQLLVEEYELQKHHFTQSAANRSMSEEQTKRLDQLLSARDSFIAKRIADTLHENEVGLLFLGALHRLDGLLAADIRVEPLGEGLHEAIRGPRS